MNKIVILGGARDFHAMDWYRTVQKNMTNKEVVFLTDLIESEGYSNIVLKTDNIEKLFIIDKFLFKKQSTFGNIWRNIFKLLVLPIQIYKLKKFNEKNPNSIFHAHPMYYMLLCWLSGLKYIGTPQGSEILVRPKKSKLYKYFAIKILQSAKYVTVDSINMKDIIFELSGVKAKIVQNGIDVFELLKYNNLNIYKNRIVSIRGMTELYRIDEIVTVRNNTNSKLPITFIYPFYEESYQIEIRSKLISNDNDLGRLDKDSMYILLSQSKLVISIPKSDSSPRSVYESIFSGACVAITYNNYFNTLPECMQKRIYIVNLENKNWLNEAIVFADKISHIKYIPSSEALELFDQDISIKKVINTLYSDIGEK